MAKTCLRCGVHLLDSEECTCVALAAQKTVETVKAQPGNAAGCLGLGMVCAAMLMWFFIQSPNSGSSTQSQSPASLSLGASSAASVVDPEPHELVTLKKWSWEKGGFGSVFKGNFTISNQNKYAVIDLKIGCLLFGKSGTELGNVAEVVYDTIAPGKTLRITDFSMGFMPQQSSSGICKVVKAERVQ